MDEYWTGEHNAPRFITDMGHKVIATSTVAGKTVKLDLGRYAVWSYDERGKDQVLATGNNLRELKKKYGRALPVVSLRRGDFEAVLSKKAKGQKAMRPDNLDRAEWASFAVASHSRATRAGREPMEDQIGDLLCNLLHLAASNDMDVNKALARAEQCYRAEVREQEVSAEDDILDALTQQSYISFAPNPAIESVIRQGYVKFIGKGADGYAEYELTRKGRARARFLFGERVGEHNRRGRARILFDAGRDMLGKRGTRYAVWAYDPRAPSWRDHGEIIDVGGLRRLKKKHAKGKDLRMYDLPLFARHTHGLDGYHPQGLSLKQYLAWLQDQYQPNFDAYLAETTGTLPPLRLVGRRR
ncbi:hypothetical protein CMI47_02745 [Candidatus Pacearchaeota archaeon]|nr:hypothetical protein [Candidatus Pacearchaeota archaeon]|tara:strand:+ start:4456 stop:5523 length:1068 start_codon:yes stop_codon:yes gene_type:complete